jgi:hypothetical protein
MSRSAATSETGPGGGSFDTGAPGGKRRWDAPPTPPQGDIRAPSPHTPIYRLGSARRRLTKHGDTRSWRRAPWAAMAARGPTASQGVGREMAGDSAARNCHSPPSGPQGARLTPVGNRLPAFRSCADPGTGPRPGSKVACFGCVSCLVIRSSLALEAAEALRTVLDI